MLRMPGTSYRGSFLALNETERAIQTQLMQHLQVLSNDIGERNILQPKNLEEAAQYIQSTFEDLQYDVTVQMFETEHVPVKNIIAEKRGFRKPEEILVVGAHYDTVPNCPGADDNTSGVAGILEIARLLKDVSLEKTLRFVAFVNEEPPFFYSKQMGSWQYAARCRQNKNNIIGMLSVESIGYYSEEPKTQFYFFPLEFFYPNTANFIGFVSNLYSRRLLQMVIHLFRQSVSFPSEGLAAPSFLPGIGWSDQWAFWRHGYRAIMITDTALFRNPYYHSPQDVLNTLNYPRMARVVSGISKVVERLCSPSI